jgi:hypothetical protein
MQMDAHYVSTKATYVRPRHYRERLLMEMEAAVGQRFAPLLALCAHHGQPNNKVRHNAVMRVYNSMENHIAVSCSVQSTACGEQGDTVHAWRLPAWCSK